jgi:hypothetical protein
LLRDIYRDVQCITVNRTRLRFKIVLHVLNLILIRDVISVLTSDQKSIIQITDNTLNRVRFACICAYHIFPLSNTWSSVARDFKPR